MTIQNSENSSPRTTLQVTTATRQRLQSIFEHAQRCEEKRDFTYANDLYTQCVTEDPANLIYLQHWWTNLTKLHSEGRKGRLKGWGIRNPLGTSALAKLIAKGDWSEVFRAGCNSLRRHPNDATTLLELADACRQLQLEECQLFYLKRALDVDPKGEGVNRKVGAALAELGMFEPAIACWRRVLTIRPEDQEAEKAVAQLSVEKTIKDGGYNENLLGNAPDAEGGTACPADVVESNAGPLDETASALADERGADQAEAERPSAVSQDGHRLKPGQRVEQRGKPDATEERLRSDLEQDPTNLDAYERLAEWYVGEQRFPEAERVLTKALAASGGGLAVRESLEDVQLQRVRHQVQIARNRAKAEKTQSALKLMERVEMQANQTEVEIFAVRSAREPGNILLKYELGVRLQRAGKYREAIKAFQDARGDTRRATKIHLHLGQCFAEIRQPKLAMSSFEAGIEACSDLDIDTKKLALYLAGVLAIEMQSEERAEQYLSELASLDFAYRDVADLLDRLADGKDGG